MRTNFLFVNDAMCKLSGYSKAMLENKMKSKDLVYFEDLQIFQFYHKNRRINHEMAPQRYEFRMVDHKKRIKSVLKIVTLIPGTKISVSSLIDISGIKDKESKIKYLSFHDSLTGLYNRAYFEVELKRIDNPRHYPISIVMEDLNGLKLVNDLFGYREGDIAPTGLSDRVQREPERCKHAENDPCKA